MRIRLEINLFAFILFTFSCGSGASDQTPGSESTQHIDSTLNHEQTLLDVRSDDSLKIHGKDIWIRSVPSTGEVIMKLNEGDACKIIETGKKETIHGRPDLWYKIDFKGKQGWVFGSQTDKMLLKPMDQKLTGSLNAMCENQLVREFETPPSYTFQFSDNNTFAFSVAAGYTINGTYEQTEHVIALSSLKLSMEGPKGSNHSRLSGMIVFEVFFKDEVICLAEKKNTLADKTYGPAAGCYCLTK